SRGLILRASARAGGPTARRVDRLSANGFRCQAGRAARHRAPRGRRHAIVEPSGLKAPMTVEQRELHRPDRQALRARDPAKAGEIALPVPGREPSATCLPGHGAHRVEKLPDADVEHAVAPWIDQREDGRSHWNADAGEGGERLEPPALVT